MQRIPNAEIARLLAEIGEYLEMQGVAFKPRAYEKAAQAIQGSDEDLHDVYARGGRKAIEEIPGIGASIAEKIEELLRTGRLKYYEELKKKTPVNLEALTAIEGLGPKSIKKLYEELGVRTLPDLEKAAKTGKIARLSGFGAKTEENILKGIGFVKRSGGRAVTGFVMPEIRTIEARLRGLAGVERVVVAGSTRRRKETIGDIDILVVSRRPQPVMDFFVRMPEVVRVYAHGRTKSAVKIKSGLDVDLRVVPEGSFGAALGYFTGSKDHNVALRQIALSRGLKLNEYGLFSAKGGSASGGKGHWKQIAGRTEEELYRALGMDHIEPELRENHGEIELAKAHKLPDIVGYSDLKGDLQVQTDWTDGSASIEEMAKAARDAGLEYIAVTDHTKRLAMTHGLDEKRIVKQWAEIDRVNRKLKGKIMVLKGSECDILRDGTLDLADATLAKLDVVGASVHSYFNLPRKEQTVRIIRAMENQHVDIIFHPTGRVLNKRDAYDIDIEALVAAAKRTGTVLEVDAYPDRADLKDDHIRLAVEAGVKLSIDSDAHHPGHYQYLEYGIAQARRGWATKRDIINAWPVEKMKEMLKS